MNAAELQEWFKTCKYVDTVYEDHDSSENHYERRIFRDSEGRFWSLEFLNGNACSKFDGKRYIRGCYEPRKVTPFKRVVEITDYFTDEEILADARRLAGLPRTRVF